MKTEIVPSRTRQERAKAVSEAVALLRDGETVALPTETVYGLAADALNPIAVAKIFEAKQRPRFDPLIMHLPGASWLEQQDVVHINDRVVGRSAMLSPDGAGVVEAFQSCMPRLHIGKPTQPDKLIGMVAIAKLTDK